MTETTLRDPRLHAPRYTCHKVVQALKIHSTEPFKGDDLEACIAITFKEDGFGPLEVPDDGKAWQAGGYWVRYTDGYESYSPAQAFEEGYTPLLPVPTDRARRQLVVLVLEDQAQRRNVLEAILGSHVDLRFAQDVNDAKTQMQAWRPDLYLIDHDLGGHSFVASGPGTGWEFLQHVVATAPVPPRVIIHSLNPDGALSMRTVCPQAVCIPFPILQRGLDAMRRANVGQLLAATLWAWSDPECPSWQEPGAVASKDAVMEFSDQV